MSYFTDKKPKRSKAPKRIHGHKIKVYNLSNIAKAVTHKAKPTSSNAVVHKKRGTHKKPKHAGPHPKVVYTPTVESIDHAKAALARVYRRASTHKHERKIRVEKLSDIQKSGTVKSIKPKKLTGPAASKA